MLKNKMLNKLSKVVILAGGKGTRFLPVTENTPKALIEIKEKKLIEYVLENIPSFIEEVIVVNKYLGNKLEEFLNKYSKIKKISNVTQGNMLGTFGALYSVKDFLNDDELFGVFNCDDILEKKEVFDFLKLNRPTMGVSYAEMPETYYSVLSEKNFFSGFKKRENPDRNKKRKDLFFTGACVLSKEVFDFEPVEIFDGEFGLPQTLEKNKDNYPMQIFEFSKWYSINKPEDVQNFLNSQKSS